MKQMIVFVSAMVFSVAMFAGCDSKGKDCAKLYEKGMTCVKEAKMVVRPKMADKDKFVKECKEHYDEAKEMMKMECKDLSRVFGKQGEEKPVDGEMPAPADMPAADMPADMPAADMPAEPAPADMPAEEAK
jgi:hypothetical protein